VTRLLLLVEGQSEMAFVRDTLASHLAGFGVHAVPIVMRTKLTAQGGWKQGGIGNWAVINRNLRSLLRDTSSYVSTMLDFYGLPDDFPGKGELLGSSDVYAAVEKLERRFAEEVNSPRFVPFLTLFEFEALVFALPRAVAEHFGLPRLEHVLQGIVDDATSPELIDGGENTHPKRRLVELIDFPDAAYEAKSDGPMIVQQIGIPAIRAACRHFDAWVGQLESLGESDDANQQ
jgi:hypothetical protein